MISRCRSDQRRLDLPPGVLGLWFPFALVLVTGNPLNHSVTNDGTLHALFDSVELIVGGGLLLLSLALGIIPCVPGFLNAVGFVALQSDTAADPALPRIADIWGSLYHYTWFISFGVSFLAYVLLTPIFRTRSPK